MLDLQSRLENFFSGLLFLVKPAALIKIFVQDPRWIMSPMHANPFDSVNIFRDTKCKRAMGIHWGTWVLTEEDVLEPPQLLKKALSRSGIPDTGVFDVCEIGESREF